MLNIVLKNLLSSKIFWVCLVVIGIVFAIYLKIDSLDKIISEKDKVILEKDSLIKDKDIVIKDYESDITINKLLIETHINSIKSLESELDRQNKTIESLKIDNDNISKIIEEHKKVKPSTIIKPVIVPAGSKKETTKYKGMRYEDL